MAGKTLAEPLNLPPLPGRPRYIREAERALRQQGNPGLEVIKRRRHTSVVGRHPDTLTPEEFEEMGHVPRPLLKVIRAQCIDWCCGGRVHDVRDCDFTDCLSWDYRMGTNPHRKKRAPSKARAAQLKAARESRGGQDAV